MRSKEKFKVDFIGVGAPKAGTTWLASLLQESPEISFSLQKEPSFFNAQSIWGEKNNQYKKGLSYYTLFWSKHTKSYQLKGEFSTDYLFDKETPLRIHKHFPQVKIIIVLREQVERMHSEFLYARDFRARFPENMSFEEYLEVHPLALKRSKYFEQVRRYFNYFPKENILVLFNEEIKTKPRETAQKLEKFLGLRKKLKFKKLRKNEYRKIRSKKLYVLQRQLNILAYFFYCSLIEPLFGKKRVKQSLFFKYYLDFYSYLRNLNTTQSKKQRLKEETRRKLKNYFKEDNKKLSKLLKRRLPWEKS